MGYELQAVLAAADLLPARAADLPVVPLDHGMALVRAMSRAARGRPRSAARTRGQPDLPRAGPPRGGCDGSLDEFDTVGLGRHRETGDWAASLDLGQPSPALERAGAVGEGGPVPGQRDPPAVGAVQQQPEPGSDG